MVVFDEKNPSQLVTSPSTYGGQNEPYSTTSRQSGFVSLPDLEKKDMIYKRRIRLLRAISRLIALILNAFMVGTLSYALAKYFLTRNHIIAGNVHPWVTPAVLWPTFMLLAIAAITFMMNFVTLCTYMCGVGAANKTASVASIIGYMMLAAHVVVWAVGMGLFKMANNGKDLWGYSCSDSADQIQAQVQSFLDFGKLCTTQTGAWYASIVETIAYGLTFLTTLFMMLRYRHQKKLTKVREDLEREQSQTQ